MKQLSFFAKTETEHGGEIRLGKRKSARVLCTKRPLHLVLKAKKNGLYQKRAYFESQIYKYAARFRLHIYTIAVNHNHIHFVAKIATRELYKSFIKVLTGALALTFGKGIWALLPYSRVVEWGQALRAVMAYLKKNREEASGERAYEPRWYRSRDSSNKKKGEGGKKTA